MYRTNRIMGYSPCAEKYFKGLFDFPVGMKEGMRKKPAPDARTAAVLEHFGAAREDAVFIGDSDVDVQTALNAHLTCVGVTWGFRDREVLENAGAKIIVDDTEEMLKGNFGWTIGDGFHEVGKIQN